MKNTIYMIYISGDVEYIISQEFETIEDAQGYLVRNDYKPETWREDGMGFYKEGEGLTIYASICKLKNSRATRVTIDGKEYTLKGLAKEKGLSYETIRKRHVKGLRGKDLIKTPRKYKERE